MKRYSVFYNRELGSGSFATVYQGKDLQTNSPIAIKVFSKVQVLMNDEKRSTLKSQMKAIELKHENIINYKQLAECENNYYLVMELCQTDLRKKLNTQQLNEKQAIDFLYQICNAMRCLIQNNYVHRDLKPQNILLKENKIRLSDFGCSKKILHPYVQISQLAGSISYMSPQALKGQNYSSISEIWSIGLIFYEMLHNKSPWFKQNDNKQSLIHKIKTNRLSFSSNISQKSKDFLKKCLHFEKQQRMNWDQFFAHQIFQNKFQDYFKSQNEIDMNISNLLSTFNKKMFEHGIKTRRFFHSLYPNLQTIDEQQFTKMVKWINPNIQKQTMIKLFSKLDIQYKGRASISYFMQLVNDNCSNWQLNSDLSSIIPFKKNISAPQQAFPSKFSYIEEINGITDLPSIIEKVANKENRVKILQEFEKITKIKGFLNRDQFIIFLTSLCKDLTNNQIKIFYHGVKQSDSYIYLQSLLKIFGQKKILAKSISSNLSIKENLKQ